MDAKYLEGIKAREQAATPGPWKVGDGDEKSYFRGSEAVISKLRVVTDRAVYGDDSAFDGQTYSDIAFIAHSRADIPALLAEVERLQKEVWKKELAFGQLTHYNSTQDKQIATLEKALEIASEQANTLFNKLELFGIISPKTKASCIQDNVDTWIQQAQEQEAQQK